MFNFILFGEYPIFHLLTKQPKLLHVPAPVSKGVCVQNLTNRTPLKPKYVYIMHVFKCLVYVHQYVCVSCLYWKTSLSPAKAGDQHAHNKRTQQTSDSEDRHGERVHEGQGLLVKCSSSSIYHCLVVKVLYVLRGYKNG